jgi:hypothetical protein
VPGSPCSYSWTTEEIQAFWQDLTAFETRYPDDNIIGEDHFLGSIVLTSGGAGFGRVFPDQIAHRFTKV